MSEPRPPGDDRGHGRRIVAGACGSCAALSLCIAAGFTAYFGLRGDGGAAHTVAAKGGVVSEKGVLVRFPEGAVSRATTGGVPVVDPPRRPAPTNPPARGFL